MCGTATSTGKPKLLARDERLESVSSVPSTGGTCTWGARTAAAGATVVRAARSRTSGKALASSPAAAS